MSQKNTRIRDITPYSLRMPDTLKEKLMQRASKNGRSLNAEMVMILQSAQERTCEYTQPHRVSDLLLALQCY
ncbi:Arc family DNA-binding protein [Proteus mirabilis]